MEIHGRDAGRMCRASRFGTGAGISEGHETVEARVVNFRPVTPSLEREGWNFVICFGCYETDVIYVARSFNIWTLSPMQRMQIHPPNVSREQLTRVQVISRLHQSTVYETFRCLRRTFYPKIYLQGNVGRASHAHLR